MTDGSPNGNPGNCAPGGGRPDVWDGNLGTSDDDFECAVYYGFLAAQNNVTVYTIGIGAGANQDVLTAMATGWDPRGDDPDVQMFTGGQGQFFPAAKPTDLDLIFDQILSNIYVRIIG
jgi:secreted protein with Ig-like and vWFA domain